MNEQEEREAVYQEAKNPFPLACWVCESCPWTSDRPELNGPIDHETRTGHKTKPTVKAASAWAPVLGKIDRKRERDGIKW